MQYVVDKNGRSILQKIGQLDIDVPNPESRLRKEYFNLHFYGLQLY